jgi:hypothetical protein
MEVVSTSERFYCPLAGGAGHFPLTFVDCYLYRERSGKRVSYYYYHPEYGALGYLQYVDGRLRNSYVLEEYHSFSF